MTFWDWAERHPVMFYVITLAIFCVADDLVRGLVGFAK